MSPTGFPECNVVLGPPKGQTEEQCLNLPIAQRIGPRHSSVFSVWELSDDEFEALAITRKIVLSVSGDGFTQPPVWLGVYIPGVIDGMHAHFNKKA